VYVQEDVATCSSWLILAIFLANPGASHATVLTFDALAGGGVVPSGYGDRVSGDFGGWGYVEGNGWTPNVGVAFDSLLLSDNGLAGAGLNLWGGGFGDLSVVAYPAGGVAGFAGVFEFTPDPGYAVRINRFQLGGCPTTDYDDQPIRITDGGFTVLWAAGSSHVEGSEMIGEALVPSHSEFTPDFTSARPIFLIYGNNWNIGIDNIDFDQVAVPEPSTLALVSLALLLPASALRRRARA
jgi:hypothetical protein